LVVEVVVVVVVVVVMVGVVDVVVVVVVVVAGEYAKVADAFVVPDNELPQLAPRVKVPATQLDVPPRVKMYEYDPVEPSTVAEPTASGEPPDGPRIFRKTDVPFPGAGDTAPEVTSFWFPM